MFSGLLVVSCGLLIVASVLLHQDGVRHRIAMLLDDEEHGVFAMRAPKRPNQIGLSIVRLVKCENNILTIKDIDILDNTPLLDIKPYIKWDIKDNIKMGWMEKKMIDNIHLADDRFE